MVTIGSKAKRELIRIVLLNSTRCKAIGFLLILVILLFKIVGDSMIAIYTRQSIDKKDSISIETQIEFCKHEAFNKDIKVYQDKGYSGKNTNRPAFEQLMDDIDSGLITKVVVYRLDRISRSIVDFADFINTLEEKKVSFVSATEKFDTGTPMGRAMLYIIIVFAQLERETIALRLKDNYYERVKRGALGGGPAPYGFDIEKTTLNGKKISILKPNNNIENVKLMFKKYSEPGTTLADVQRMLLSKGIYTASGKSWDNAKIATILKSPSYVKADASIYNYYRIKGAEVANDVSEFNGVNACVLVGKREANSRKYSDVTNHVLAIAAHDGVIDSSTFLYVQDKLSQNKQIKNLHKGKYSWLTGYVKCAGCGYAMCVRKGNTKEGIINYFVCSGKYLYHICDLKQTHRVSTVEDAVESAILERIKAIRLDNTPTEQSDNEATYNSQIAEIDAKINSLIDSLEESSNVSMGYINKRIQQLDSQKNALLAKQTAELRKNKKFYLPEMNYDELTFEDKKILAEILIDKVLLGNKSIEIVWK